MSHPNSEMLYVSKTVSWEIKKHSAWHFDSPLFVLDKQECKLTLNISYSSYRGECSINTVCLDFTKSYTDYHNPKFIVSLLFSNNIEHVFYLLPAVTNNDNRSFSAKAIPYNVNYKNYTILENTNCYITAVILFSKSDYKISTFINDMKSMLKSETHSDFQIKAGDKTFNVHKAVLASRSNVLKKMTENDMLEKKTCQLELQADPIVVQALLDYLYTSKCKIRVADPTELFKLAHFLELEELQMHCKTFLLNNIHSKNIISILELTSYNDYNLKDLHDTAMKFVYINEASLITDTEFLVFLYNNIKLETITYILRLSYCYQLHNCLEKALEFIRINYDDVLNDKEFEAYLKKEPTLTLKILRYCLDFFNTSCDKKA